MEGNRRLSSRLKRKPLSDCTNLPSSKLISQTLTKSHLKPPNFTASKPFNYTNINKRKQNPDFNVDENGGSIKTHTSTGSNNSPSSDTVPSQPPTPISHAGDIDFRKSRSSAVQIQIQDEQIRKDKGKSVADTPIFKAKAMLTTQAVRISSSAASAHGDCATRPLPEENDKVAEQQRKDKGKGKMVVETSITQTPALQTFRPPLTSRPPQTSSSAASGNFYLPGPAAVHSQKADVQITKAKEKMGQETTFSEASDPMTPSLLIMSPSAASGTINREKPSLITYSQRRASQRNMHPITSSCPPEKRVKKKGLQLDGGSGGHSGSHTDPLPLHKKKQSRNKNDESVHAMPDDEVAKLKAYFADIDAFELPEEVASDTE